MNRPTINVTPLIDVLLVLLIIFMVVSPLKPSRIETKIPQEANDPIPSIPNPDTLVVSIATDGSLALNNDLKYGSFADLPILISDLRKVLEMRTGGGLEKHQLQDGITARSLVFVKAPKSFSYGEVVKVIDAVKIGGADPVSLQIDDLGD